MASRCARFGGACSDEAMARHACVVPARAAFALGAYVRDDLRGVLEAYEYAVGVGVAEVALVVEQEWRRQGLGTAMVSAAMACGRHHDIDVLRFVFGAQLADAPADDVGKRPDQRLVGRSQR
jgi:GNAT superfamily N-acetyltransferase